MATDQGAITEWDEQGKPIGGGVTEWDEKGNPIGGADELSKQTKATATAAGASTAPAPMPSGYEPVTAHNDETQHPANPIYQQLAKNDQLTKRAHTMEGMPSSYDAPVSNATGALGLAEIPANVRSIGNWAASKMREPATMAQSLEGTPGTPKNILPRSMQRWTIPDWVAEGVTPKGELGTRTNPGPFNRLPMKSPINDPLPPADAARLRNPNPIPPRATAPAWKGAVPEAAPATGRAPGMANPAPSGEIAPTATETPARGNLGRVGSAGDLASWSEDNLWQGYMKNRGTPLGEALADEIKRRGQAMSAAGNVRPIPKGRP